jgi:predicted ATPase/DNA-binding SARP family transcriptional activator
MSASQIKMATLFLYLLGAPRVELNGKLIEITRRKSLALLIYLALNPGAHSRDLLATTFWPENSQRSARVNLRRALFVLNNSLPGEWIDCRRETLAISPDMDIWTDVAALRAAALDPANVDALEDTAGYYRGNFLGGFSLPDAPDFDDWVCSEAERLSHSIANNLKLLAEHYSNRRNYPKAIAFAKRRVDLDPLDESSQRALMILYARSGQRAAALKQYQECVRSLKEDLSVPPSSETTALYRQIDHGHLPRNAVSSQPGQYVDHESAGHHEHGATGSHVVLPPSTPLASVFPEGRTVAAQPLGNLPSPLTPLIGRENELAALEETLLSEDVRLVTILGPGGMGKTRLGLAMGTCSAITDAFPDGIFFVPLAPLSDHRQIAPAVAESLRLQLESRPGRKRTPQQQVSDYLREKRTLLVLDNFEHLLEGTDFIGDILEAAPAVKIVVTSRERLYHSGENVFPIYGLDTGSQEHQKVDVLGAVEPSAVTLFLECAQRTSPDFVMKPSCVSDIASICRLVEGMPLAIELAAAWVELLPPAKIEGEVRQSLDFLARDLRGVPERHRSIRAVFDATWRRMESEDQNLFMQLSTFKGGFTRSAVREVTGATFRRLSRLTGKSLVQYERQGDRYAIHELLRQYGEDQLALLPKAVEVVRDNHAAYYCRIVATREVDLKGEGQRLALAALEAEIDNIQTAWHWKCDRCDATHLAPAMNGMGLFYTLQGRYYEGMAAFAGAAEALDEFASPSASGAVAMAFVWLAAFARITGDVTRAQFSLQRAVELLDESGSQDDTSTSVRAFAFLEMANLERLRDARTAGDLYTRSLRLYEQLGDAWGMADAQEGLAYVANDISDRAEMRWRAEAAVAARRALGDRAGVARTLEKVSQAARYHGDLDEALALAKESEAIYRKLGDRVGLARALNNLGDALNWLGRTPEAQQVLEESIAANRELGDRRALANALGRLASSHARTAEYDSARREAELALSMSRNMGDLSQVVWSLMVLGKIAMYAGDYETATDHLQESLAVLDEESTWVIRAWSHSVMGSAAWGLGDLDLAREHAVRALRLGVKFTDFNTTIQALLAVALILSEGEDKARALELYDIVRLDSKINSPQWFKDVVEPHFEHVASQLAPVVSPAVRERVSTAELWTIAARLLDDLEE